MGEQKHTPGPWTCDVTDQGGSGLSAYVGVDAPESRHTVARVVCYDRALDTLPYEANARLIAAAPDMLAALKALVNADNAPLVLSDAHSVKLMDAVRAAIAKASTDEDKV